MWHHIVGGRVRRQQRQRHVPRDVWRLPGRQLGLVAETAAACLPRLVPRAPRTLSAVCASHSDNFALPRPTHSSQHFLQLCTNVCTCTSAEANAVLAHGCGGAGEDDSDGDASLVLVVVAMLACVAVGASAWYWCSRQKAARDNAAGGAASAGADDPNATVSDRCNAHASTAPLCTGACFAPCSRCVAGDGWLGVLAAQHTYVCSGPRCQQDSSATTSINPACQR